MKPRTRRTHGTATRLAIAVPCALVAIGGGCAEPISPRSDAVCLEQVALGEMTDHSAVLWAREETQPFLHARVVGAPRGVVASFVASADHTARVRLEAPRGTSAVVVWASGGREAGEAPPDCAPRPLHLAPAADDTRPVRFAFGGDVGGQNVCRDVEHGFPTLPAFSARDVDFRILLGDLVYADDTCRSEGALDHAQIQIRSPALPSIEAYRAHWRYAEEDVAYRAMRWGAYAVWDDHEIVNDAGPHHDHVRRGRGQHVPLLPLGRRTFLEHNSLDTRPTDVATPLYRRFRWGRAIDLVLLDTRSYRDDDGALDDAPTPKTLLGRAQRLWLEEILRSSDARWIVIASSVPLALPTGANGRRDSWAAGDTGRGFVRELRGLLDVAHRAGRRELVFVTTDVHFTSAFEHHPYHDDPGFVVHELVTGPLAAGLFPFDDYDTTLGTERVLHHVPERGVHTLADARPFFTWGEVATDARGALTLSAHNADEELWSVTLEP